MIAAAPVLIERDQYGRITGKVETIVPGERWREADRYGRTEGTIERRGDELIRRDRYGRRVPSGPATEGRTPPRGF